MAGRPRGSSPKLTAEIQKEICKALESAIPDKYAAEGNGIEERTFYYWMQKGEQGIKPYQEFRSAVTRARARGVMAMHAIALGGERYDKDGRKIKLGVHAALWFLERRFYKEYGQRQMIEHTSSDSLANMSDAELLEEREKQRQRIATYNHIKQSENKDK